MDLEELRAFLAVADTGSFLTAAKALRMPRATLRRRIDQLEARAGVLLVDRTRAGVGLTEAGRILAARGRLMVQESNALLQSVREVGSAPSGRLRILLPVGLPPHVFIPIAGMMRKYPLITYRLNFSDDPVGGLLQDVDLVIHFGDKSPPGPWVSREITRIRICLLASPSYLNRRGTPQSIEDLNGHDLLASELADDDGRRWPLRNGGTFQVAPFLTASDNHAIRQLAGAGVGIALVPHTTVSGPGETEESLLPVLPDLVGKDIGLRVIVPAMLADLPRIKVLLELVEPFVGRLGL
jgi:DNA-binding transcriptional LysR family regulator